MMAYIICSNIEFAGLIKNVHQKAVWSYRATKPYRKKVDKNIILNMIRILIYVIFQAHSPYSAVHDLRFVQTTPEFSLQVILTRHKLFKKSRHVNFMFKNTGTDLPKHHDVTFMDKLP